MNTLARLEEIARKHGLLDTEHPTFDLRHRDDLDFVDASVRAIGQALDEAYQTGAKIAVAKYCPECGAHRPQDNAYICGTCCEELARVEADR